MSSGNGKEVFSLKSGRDPEKQSLPQTSLVLTGNPGRKCFPKVTQKGTKVETQVFSEVDPETEIVPRHSLIPGRDVRGPSCMDTSETLAKDGDENSLVQSANKLPDNVKMYKYPSRKAKRSKSTKELRSKKKTKSKVSYPEFSRVNPDMRITVRVLPKDGGEPRRDPMRQILVTLKERPRILGSSQKCENFCFEVCLTSAEAVPMDWFTCLS
ncbi:unnamed protein product [Allacma fusca]|uniref:Uncharacterized protein n=1 Tax=Allacma fusca TaxID=39272 RepID=A0A8J2L0N6_9HEXA|nr:unnamed protein product [Allacma fusca]